MSSCCSPLDGEEQEHSEVYASPFLVALQKKHDLFWEEDEELISLFSREKTEHEKLLCSSVSSPSPSSSSVMWMLKVSSRYGFATLTAVLAVNYLHRFSNSVEFERDAWQAQLAAVACLSLAAKVEETQVPLLLDLQVEDPEFVFGAKTIQRMELLVLSTLRWKMHPVTPVSFLERIFQRLGLGRELLRRCERLLLSAVADSRFMDHRPSAMAAGTMLHVIERVEPCNAGECRDQLLGALKMSKEMVSSCYDLISELSEAGNGDSDVIDAPLGCDDCSSDSWSSSSSSVYSSAETEHALFKRKKTRV